MLSNQDHPMDEDCLTLNIWAPAKAEKAPVFIWIYGGGNHFGDTVTRFYQLDSFARSGVIGVSFNYRLGPFGFYDFSKIDDSFDSNCAASDMILAAGWVKENIEAFGGDADNITICGQSAGGTGVFALLAAPSARGTFNKAIAMSGVPGNITTQRTQDMNNSIFFKNLGIKPDEVLKLKTMSYEEIRDACITISAERDNQYPGSFVSGHVIDDLLPQKPWDALADGAAADVKCIFGTTRDEGTIYHMKSWDKIEEMLKNSGYPEKLPLFKEIYGNLKEKKAMQQISTDRMSWVDTVRCSLAQSKHGLVYSYRFDFVPPMLKMLRMGAMHGSDIFPALDNSIKASGKRSKQSERMAGIMHGAYINFVKTGDPNADLQVRWEPYEEQKRATYIFNETCHVEHDPYRKTFDVWEDIALYE